MGGISELEAKACNSMRPNTVIGPTRRTRKFRRCRTEPWSPDTGTVLPPTPRAPTLNLAVIGAGPVGLALALLAARRLPQAAVTVFDARPSDRDVSGDARTLALSLGSVQLLQRLNAWAPERAEPILEVRVSQPPTVLPLPGWLGAPQVTLRAADLGVSQLGAVLPYGALVAPLRQAWDAAVAAEPQRLASRWGAAVNGLKLVANGVEVDAAVAETFGLAVVAEGGVFGDRAPDVATTVSHDYQQNAWVGTVMLEGAAPGVAVERFTRHGPAALLPLPRLAGQPSAAQSAALVWCVPRADDPVRDLNDAQRLAVLHTVFDPAQGRITSVSSLKCFPLGLVAQKTLVRGREVRIGNAAQTLHPVAGQGLNLGLRDAYALADALRYAPSIDAALRTVTWQRTPDRWAMIAATDFLARSFTWQLPGADVARGLGLALLERAGPLKKLLAREMMFGQR
jgi:2-octaprenyl-6-methoxyphenol hydroxylase